MGEVIESSQPKKHMICLMINGEDELSLCFNRRGRRGYVASERRQTVLNSSPVSTTEFSDVKGLALIQQMVAHPVGACGLPVQTDGTGMATLFFDEESRL